MSQSSRRRPRNLEIGVSRFRAPKMNNLHHKGPSKLATTPGSDDNENERIRQSVASISELFYASTHECAAELDAALADLQFLSRTHPSHHPSSHHGVSITTIKNDTPKVPSASSRRASVSPPAVPPSHLFPLNVPPIVHSESLAPVGEGETSSTQEIREDADSCSIRISTMQAAEYSALRSANASLTTQINDAQIALETLQRAHIDLRIECDAIREDNRSLRLSLQREGAATKRLNAGVSTAALMRSLQRDNDVLLARLEDSKADLRRCQQSLVASNETVTSLRNELMEPGIPDGDGASSSAVRPRTAGAQPGTAAQRAVSEHIPALVSNSTHVAPRALRETTDETLVRLSEQLRSARMSQLAGQLKLSATEGGSSMPIIYIHASHISSSGTPSLPNLGRISERAEASVARRPHPALQLPAGSYSILEEHPATAISTRDQRIADMLVELSKLQGELVTIRTERDAARKRISKLEGLETVVNTQNEALRCLTLERQQALLSVSDGDNLTPLYGAFEAADAAWAVAVDVATAAADLRCPNCAGREAAVRHAAKQTPKKYRRRTSSATALSERTSTSGTETTTADVPLPVPGQSAEVADGTIKSD